MTDFDADRWLQGTGNGRCLAALSEYMYESDLRNDVDDVQNVTSYFIGFGDDFYDGEPEYGVRAAAGCRHPRWRRRPTPPRTAPA